MKVAVFDIEANGLLDTVSAIHCGVFKDIDTKKVVKFIPDQMEEMCTFMDGYDVLIGHNIIGYDFPALKKVLGYTYKGKMVDTLIMSRLLNPKRLLPPHAVNKRAGPHGLYAWGVRVGVDKPEHEDWENFSPEMLHRCSEDVEINYLVYLELLKEGKGQNWKNAYQLTFKLFENLQKQEDYGWLVDREHMEKSINMLDNWIRRIDQVITPHLPDIMEVDETKKAGEYGFVRKPFLKSGAYSEASIRFIGDAGYDPDSDIVAGCFTRVSFRKVDLNSNMETKDFLLGLGWEPLEWNTDDKGNRTSPKLSKDDPFEGIEGKIGNLVAKRVQCRHRKSSIEGFLKLIRPDGTIPSVIANIAVTGRVTHKNIVNIPGAKSFFGKQMRKIFISRPGMVIVGTDSDACQIRMLAGRMNDPAYTEVVVNGKKENGTDMHTINMKAAILPNRDDAKTFFYGFLFGAGDAKIGKIVKGSAQRGRELKENFLKGLPALGSLVERLTAEWKKTAKKRFNPKFNRMELYNGVVTGLDGRPIVIPSEHQILVYILQSDEAIMMAAAFNRVSKLLEKEGYVYGVDYGFLCWMHDEYNIECLESIAERVKTLSEEAIAWAGKFFNISCPHIGHGSIGKNWYEVH